MKYSIIIPVYNAEKYLKETMDSIFAQDTKEAYEIILVDDGSKDTSPVLCDSYAEKNPCVRVIHQKNQGVSVARNTGIAAAAGEYLLFVDADDLIASDLLSVLSPATENGADMIAFCEHIFRGDEVIQIVKPPLFPLEGGERGQIYLERHFQTNQIPLYGCYNYLFRSAFLVDNGLGFPPGQKVNEDLDFMLRCMEKAEVVCGVDYIGYFYRTHAESVVNTPTPEKTMMYLQSAVKWFRIYPQAHFADLFVAAGVGVSAVGSREEVKSLTDFMWKNRDIWGHTVRPTLKLAATLFRLFGCYTGSRVILLLIKIKQVLSGKRVAK